MEQTLSLLPGVTVANRTNPSQDTRISVRGFGARSQFGARSIRILRDGMPLTLPDGQTPIDYLDLESVSRVEVIRGSASALYGNASGGVIDLRSVDAPAAPFVVQARSFAGASALRRYVALFGGSEGAMAYQGNIGRTVSDGFPSAGTLLPVFGESVKTGALGGCWPPTRYEALSGEVDEPRRAGAPGSGGRKSVHQVQLDFH